MLLRGCAEEVARHDRRAEQREARCSSEAVPRRLPVMIDLRAAGDRDLAGKLRDHAEIRSKIELIERDSEKIRARRHLLATALRLSPRAAPEVHGIVDD